MTLRIRPFRDEDAPALYAVYHSAIHGLAARDYDRAQLDAWAPATADPPRWLARLRGIRPFVAWDESGIAGYADVQESGLIDHFFVASDRARQGVGSRLMHRLHVVALARGTAGLTSEVSLTAQPFYAAHGFEIVQRQVPVVRGVAIPNARMRKALPSATHGTVFFATERLLARPLGPGDVEALLAVYGDEDAMRWVGDGRALDRARCEAWVAVTRDNYERRGYGMMALVEREGGAVAGFCGLVHPGGQEAAEVKYALRRDRWGRGLATEAVRGILAHAAVAYGLDEVIATVAPDNAASHAVLLKAGMARGVLRPNDDGTFTQLYGWRRDGR